MINRKKKEPLAVIFANFLKHLTKKAFSRSLRYSVRKANYQEKRSKFYLSIKDPFIGRLNHGATL
jgi:hypothetical protein